VQKCFAAQREGKIELIKGIASGHGFQITPLPQEVLIVWGEFDQIFPVAKAGKVKEKLGEKATVRIIPNTGHLPQQEDSKLFNKILLDFLLPPPSSSNGKAATK
jgi:pimeloyl-ACP methyl ester carboxylesterase